MDIDDDMEDLTNEIKMRENDRNDSSTNLTKITHVSNTDIYSSTNSNE
jgi:hypothetical protein